MGAPFENAMLLGRRQARIQGEHLDGVGNRGPPARLDVPASELVGEGGLRVANLALAREEDEDVARPFGHELLAGLDDPGRLVDRLTVAVVPDKRTVADFDGVRAPGDFHDGCVEMLGEALRVDRGGGDDHLEVGPPRQEAGQVS